MDEKDLDELKVEIEKGLEEIKVPAKRLAWTMVVIAFLGTIVSGIGILALFTIGCFIAKWVFGA